MKKRDTYTSLVLSMLSIVLSMAMLAGTTFAWFTVSVTSGMNKILSGNLHVELEYSHNGEDWETVDANTNVFCDKPNATSEEDKGQWAWEPGCTRVVYLRVTNTGSMALKYRLGIRIASEKSGKTDQDEVFKLSENIRFGIVESDTGRFKPYPESDAGREEAREAVEGSAVTISEGYSSDGKYLPEAEKSSKIIALVVYMPESVGAEANPSPNKADQPELYLGISLVATQLEGEADSFDKNYDANAPLEGEVVRYSFANASDALALCADCFNLPDSEHSGHKKYSIIENGVAKIPQEGAWLEFDNLNWSENTYVLEYDIDLSDLPDGAFVSFDSGEKPGWADLRLGFKNDSDTITAYNILEYKKLTDDNSLGTIGKQVHAVYTYTVRGTDLYMRMTISDGKTSYTVERESKNINSATKLYWDVYETFGGGNPYYAALDNIVFRTENRMPALVQQGYVPVATADDLEKALNDGGKVVLTSGVTVDNTIEVNDGKTAVVDLNGQKLSSTGDSAVNVEKGGKAEFSNGTVESKGYGVVSTGGNVKLTNMNINAGNYAVAAYGGSSVDMTKCEFTVEDDESDAVFLDGGSSVKLTNVKIMADDCGVISKGNNDKVEVIGCEIHSAFHGVYHNGTFAPATITIKDTTIVDTESSGVYISNSTSHTDLQTLIIDNCNITGEMTAVEVKHTNATITNSILTATLDYNDTFDEKTPFGKAQQGVTASQSGVSAWGYAFASTINKGEVGNGRGTVTLTGNTYNIPATIETAVIHDGEATDNVARIYTEPGVTLSGSDFSTVDQGNAD